MIGFSEQEKKIFEETLESFLSADHPLHEELFAAMRYSAMAGGKRLRPYLLVTFCRLFGGTFEQALPFACALEMIHTYSLIHDDLPAMDNDDLRRGKPTNHKVFGESHAIIAGDALQSRAFEIMLSEEAASAVGAQRALRAASVLAKKAGACGMCGGQEIDLRYEGREITPEILLRMDLEKTGALLSAAAVMGAVIAGAPESALAPAEEYAEHLGVAFQITDDLLDLGGGEETFGKPIGSDLKNGKSTYVSLYGAEGARAQAALHTGKAMAAAALLPGGDILSSFADQLLKRTY